ncbi:MAG: glycosyltransferase [Chloroflexota bacterium]|nr:MAG: glycosyltransferase [Chloroflexota bacterium]
MFDSVPVPPKRLEEYRPIVGDAVIAELKELASQLQGARVLHLNATAFGGGVAEILTAMVPLLNDLGLVADWQVIKGANEFYQVTKAIHNGLQGMFVSWTPEMVATWMRYNQLNADLFDQPYDFVVVHDPQPAGILRFLENRQARVLGKRWLWRCHIDLTEAQPDIWDFLRPYVDAYDLVIFTLDKFVKDGLEGPLVRIIPPAIDPMSVKNTPMSRESVENILRSHGVDAQRPYLCQVSRFDPWKDPTGVIDAYRLVKRSFPEMQLVLVASMAHDDPEGWTFYERTARRAGEDWDVHLLTNLHGVGNLEVNAFQTAAEVVIQKSLREGFGLTVTEALWKERPVVAGHAGGIPLQVRHGETGYLVSSVEECAEQIHFLLRNQYAARTLGKTGREHVRENFLITRNVRDYLRAFVGLL